MLRRVRVVLRRTSEQGREQPRIGAGPSVALSCVNAETVLAFAVCENGAATP